MKPEEIFVARVLERIPGPALRRQIELELRGHIAERLQGGASVEETLAQLGDPVALAESYVASVPLMRAPMLRRIAAKVVDVIIIVSWPLFVTLMAVLSGATRDDFPFQPLPAILYAIAFLATVVVASLYTVLSEYWTGQTVGKRLFGLRVVTEAGMRISFGQAVLRQLPVVLQIAMVDALFALFTKHRQRAFELVTRTRTVVAEERATAIAATA